MNNRLELQFTGSGGQGVILISVILAEAALLAGKKVAQTQSYGPEARGGLCKAELVLSSGDPIDFPKVTKPDFLLALTQASMNRYSRALPENAVILADDSLCVPDGVTARVIKAPILQTALEKVGKSITANIVALGAINKLLDLVPPEALNQAVLNRIPKGTEKLNTKALEEGALLI